MHPEPLNSAGDAGVDPTGDARVDAAIAGLAGLDDMELADRPAVLEAVHDRLREILGELGDAGRPAHSGQGRDSGHSASPGASGAGAYGAGASGAGASGAGASGAGASGAGASGAGASGAGASGAGASGAGAYGAGASGAGASGAGASGARPSGGRAAGGDVAGDGDPRP